MIETTEDVIKILQYIRACSIYYVVQKFKNLRVFYFFIVMTYDLTKTSLIDQVYNK